MGQTDLIPRHQREIGLSSTDSNRSVLITHRASCGRLGRSCPPLGDWTNAAFQQLHETMPWSITPLRRFNSLLNGAEVKMPPAPLTFKQGKREADGQAQQRRLVL